MTKADLTRKLSSPYYNRTVNIVDSKGNKTDARITHLTENMLTVSVGLPVPKMGIHHHGTKIQFVYWHKNIATQYGLNTTGKRNYDWYLFQINHKIIYSCPEIKDSISIQF